MLWFELSEEWDPDGVLRLTLVGELDIAVVHALLTEIRRHRRQGRQIRLDLSQLEFIDGGAINLLASELTEVCPAGSRLDVDRRIGRTVSRAVALSRAHAELWPSQQGS